jgi:hypothetical protein
MRQKITQVHLRARTLGVDEELLTAVEETFGGKSVEDYREGIYQTQCRTMKDYLESLLMPPSGIIGLYSQEQREQLNNQ